MAYDASTDTVCGVTGGGLLVSVNKWTGELTELGNIGIDTNTWQTTVRVHLHCFTCTEVRAAIADLYSFTLDESGGARPLRWSVPLIPAMSKSSGISTMEYDPVNQILCLFLHSGIPYDYSYYYELTRHR